MTRIEGFRIQNFRSLKDVTLGRMPGNQDAEPLTNLVTFIGKNGTGKSSLLDAFSFLSDTLKFGLNDACHLHNRGGVNNLRTQGQAEPITFEICYRGRDNETMLYTLSITPTKDGQPFVNHESLSNGDGNGFDYDDVELSRFVKNGKLGLAAIGEYRIKRHEKFTELCDLIAGWHVNRFDADKARLPTESAAPQQYLKEDGSNLANVVRYAEKAEGGSFTARNIKEIAANLQDVSLIDTAITADDRLLLRFHNNSDELFFAQQMSVGTLKFFAYQILAGSVPPPLVCIDCPENNLHHKDLTVLVEVLRPHDSENRQAFITTHNPYLVDRLDPDEVWVLEKGNDGFTQAVHVSDISLVNNMVKEGLPLGGLWFSDYFDSDGERSRMG